MLATGLKKLSCAFLQHNGGEFHRNRREVLYTDDEIIKLCRKAGGGRREEKRNKEKQVEKHILEPRATGQNVLSLFGGLEENMFLITNAISRSAMSFYT